MDALSDLLIDTIGELISAGIDVAKDAVKTGKSLKKANTSTKTIGPLSKTYDINPSNPTLTVVFLHGLATDSSSSKPVFKILKTTNIFSNVRFLALDLLGSGKSPKLENEEYTFEKQLESLEATLSGIETPLVLVGHSMGTFIATRYTKLHPDEVLATILISAPLFLPTDLENPAFKNALKSFKQAASSNKKVNFDPQVFESELKNMVLNPENYRYLEQIEKPTTIIYGERDPIIGSQNLPALLKANSRITAIKTSGGHHVSEEKATTLLQVLEDFISDQTSSTNLKSAQDQETGANSKSSPNQKPKSKDTSKNLTLYNTLTRKLELFTTTNDAVKIYTCGPTVYSFAHIGNFTSYIYWDLLVRTLKLNGYHVRRVLNLTDVGHLTSDGDEGEDKMEKGARREGKTVFEIADFYAEDFLKNYRDLKLTPPDVLARATDYIKEDEAAVTKMAENGFTYETKDGIYFDTSKFQDYASFARLDLKGLKAGARVDFSNEKKNPADFAVWKFIQPGEKHAMRWDYLGRPGYPGWHLECSTIIHEELGEPIDIHTGGIDHIPVHHTNEIAQTFALSGLPLARFWLHCHFITVDGEKISKSLGNVYLFQDLQKRGFSHLDFKTWVLSGHYQGTRNFTFESLASAKTRRLNWRNKIALLIQKGQGKTASKAKKPNNTSAVSLSDNFSRILAAVNNNLGSPEAFALIDNLDLSFKDWEQIDALFGLDLIVSTPDLSPELYGLIESRETARKNKDFKTADKLRDELAKANVVVKDTASGPVWEYLA